MTYSFSASLEINNGKQTGYTQTNVVIQTRAEARALLNNLIADDPDRRTRPQQIVIETLLNRLSAKGRFQPLTITTNLRRS